MLGMSPTYNVSNSLPAPKSIKLLRFRYRSVISSRYSKRNPSLQDTKKKRRNFWKKLMQNDNLVVKEQWQLPIEKRDASNHAF